jgi:hypothetical protein
MTFVKGLNIMGQFLGSAESIVLVLTLVFTVYFSYRSMRIQQETTSLKASEDFSERDLAKQGLIEAHLGIAIYQEKEDMTDKFIEMNQDPANRLKLVGYLNFYESLARGLNLKIYDDRIFRMSRKAMTIKTFNIFRGFIYDYRTRYNRGTAWCEFEKLVRRWEK